MKISKKLLSLIITYGALLTIIYFLGAFILSKGWGYIDASPHRNFLYVLALYITPIVILTFIAHLIAVIIDKKIFKKSIITGLLLGFLGPLALHFAIKSSPDGEAAMAYILIPLSYSVFCFVGFILSCIVLAVKNKMSNKAFQPTPERRG
jgi:uncharacterized membrane protein